MILANSDISSSVSSTSTLFSLIRSTDEAPGMGMILGMPGRRESASTQLIATWAGVHPLRSAIFSTAAASCRFVSNTPGWNRGRARRISPSGMSASDLILPPRMPRPRGAGGVSLRQHGI